MAGLLGDVFSFGDTLKRKARGLLADPVGTLQQFVGNENDRAGRFNQLTDNAATEMQNRIKNGGKLGPNQMKLAGLLADAYNPAGMVVWHGSPHKFSKFDSSKIGTGEGSQAYGVGHYTAESPDVARSYSVMAQKPGRRQFGLTKEGKDQQIADALIKLSAKQYTNGDVGQLMDLIKQRPALFSNPDQLLSRAAEYVDNMPPAYMYKIDLPDDQIAKMIDLESAVPEDVRSSLSQSAIQKFGSGLSLGDGASLLKQIESEFKLSGSTTPSRDAAMWLREQGIPGVKFKDAGTRSLPNGGTSNFVVFPGNENLLTILERNGQPMNGLLGP
jgi:hypothetical protein